ncbi:uncharacterized protein EI90DRAFT_3029675, partial [Cantharellus anzutake]|uniref:uncharacterized protein n=1 Tax=Cantharellus anzutake TaxID=1750568 RepID=UPI001907E3D0
MIPLASVLLARDAVKGALHGPSDPPIEPGVDKRTPSLIPQRSEEEFLKNGTAYPIDAANKHKKRQREDENHHPESPCDKPSKKSRSRRALFPDLSLDGSYLRVDGGDEYVTNENHGLDLPSSVSHDRCLFPSSHDQANCAEWEVSTPEIPIKVLGNEDQREVDPPAPEPLTPFMQAASQQKDCTHGLRSQQPEDLNHRLSRGLDLDIAIHGPDITSLRDVPRTESSGFPHGGTDPVACDPRELLLDYLSSDSAEDPQRETGDCRFQDLESQVHQDSAQHVQFTTARHSRTIIHADPATHHVGAERFSQNVSVNDQGRTIPSKDLLPKVYRSVGIQVGTVTQPLVRRRSSSAPSRLVSHPLSLHEIHKFTSKAELSQSQTETFSG